MEKDLTIQQFRTVFDYCRIQCKSLERWPSYYYRRYLEFLSYYELFPEKKVGRVLELGCGIGYQSAFLAAIAGEVIATDLPEENSEAHAPGMKVAEDLHKSLNISNVKLIPCSAEALPFPDSSFDMVYSSHVLEHIPDQEKALKEIFRVLKNNGLHFCVVPTRAEKVYAFFNFYLYLFQRTMVAVLKKIGGSKKVPGQVSLAAADSNKQSSPSVLRDFPFPPPHGAYPHYLNELKAWRPSSWLKKLESVPHMKTVGFCTTQFNPLLSLFGAIIPKWGTRIHAFTRKTERKLGGIAFFRMIGLNTVMILKKVD
jgi:ubiquinone/menaquinone biosynthesis C-methylase UbiE